MKTKKKVEIEEACGLVTRTGKLVLSFYDIGKSG